VAWAPDYADLQELKDYLSIGDNADDVFLALWITTVSRNVDDFCGRQFGQVEAAEDRYYPTVYDRCERAWFAYLDDVQDTTGLTLADTDGTAVDSADYTLLPRNAAAKGRPYERVKLTAWAGGELTGHALWGWSAQPAAPKAGLFLQANRLAKRRNSAFGISGSPQEQGEIRLLARLDVDFETSLKPLIRTWWAA
jgi:hypothetical protein